MFYWLKRLAIECGDVSFIFETQLKRARSRRYPAQTVTDADYADDLALLADTPAHAESMLHSLEEAANNIGLYLNSVLSEFTCRPIFFAASSKLCSIDSACAGVSARR